MKITNKKILAASLSLGLILAGCGNNADKDAKDDSTKTETTETAQAPEENKEEENTEKSAEDYDFSVVSREDGSGTRGAFIELVGLEEEVDGEKVNASFEGSAYHDWIAFNHRYT